jgi:hypothetical protein
LEVTDSDGTCGYSECLQLVEPSDVLLGGRERGVGAHGVPVKPPRRPRLAACLGHDAEQIEARSLPGGCGSARRGQATLHFVQLPDPQRQASLAEKAGRVRVRVRTPHRTRFPLRRRLPRVNRASRRGDW